MSLFRPSTDPSSSFDPSVSSRRLAFLSLCVAMSMLGSLAVITFFQMLPLGRSNVPLDPPGGKGGWDWGNNVARVVVTMVGGMMLWMSDFFDFFDFFDSFRFFRFF